MRALLGAWGSTAIMKAADIRKKVQRSMQSGQLGEAIKLCEKLCKKEPEDPKAWTLAGVAQHQAGAIQQAVFCYKQAIHFGPDEFDAHAHLGNILFQQGDISGAAHHFHKATQINPDHPYAWCNLGMALIGLSQRHEAICCYEKALQLAPGLSQIHVLLGNAFAAEGRYEEALQCYKKGRDLQPDNLDALAGEASALERLGDKRSAWELVQPAVRNGTDNVGLAISYATLSGSFDELEEAIALLEGLNQGHNLTALQRLEIHFSLGNLYDRKGDYEAAFKHYTQANNLAPRNYLAARDKELTDRMLASCGKGAVDALKTFGNPSIQPVFIIGMPRSGTSLVEKVLASHPLVYGAGELSNVMNIASRLHELVGSGSPYPECIKSLNKEVIEDISTQYLDDLHNLAGDGYARIVNKMPHNFMHLGLIHIMFPYAKIIHCRRNPLDTCLSCYFQFFGGSNDYAYGLESLVFHYKQYLRYMHHWRDTLKIPMLEITYEDMIARQEDITRSLLDFCNLEWNDACLSFHSSRQTTRTASYDQVRQPIYDKSVDRWKNYEPFVQVLLQGLSSSHE
jgi:tetratricopeptide (TPR) repeat protein